MKISRKFHLGKLVTPAPDRERPVYRWFQLKESFSSHFVLMLLDLWKLNEHSVVLDPFCGAGTTLLACREAGFRSIGFDVHPLFLFISRAKTMDYDVEGLQLCAEDLLELDFSSSESSDAWVERYFPPNVVREILTLRAKISGMGEKERYFFLVGLMRAAIRCSWAVVDGAVLKVRKRKVRPLKQTLERTILEMIEDLKRIQTKTVDVRIEECDARRMNLPDESIDVTITSPPYLFKGEYIRAYRLEEWILDLHPPSPEIFFGGGSDEANPEEYFTDMEKFVEELARVSRPKAKACLVISDGCSKKGIVRVADRICEIADRTGFSVKKVLLVNERWCTTPSRRKIGKAGEYILIWEKK